LEDIGACRFADWRNPAVVLSPSSGCASAVYSRPGQAYVLLANTHAAPQDVQCVVFPERLPYPLTSLASARLAAGPRRTADAGDANDTRVLDARQLTRDGVSLAIPADTVLWLELRE
jgi:hypothetical protein